MNTLKSHLTLILLIGSYGIWAQQLHMPEQVEQYMKNSAIQYQIDSLMPAKDSVSFPWIEKGYFLVAGEMGNKLEKKDTSWAKKTDEYLQKARKANAKNKFKKAAKFYQKAIKDDPDNQLIINELVDFYWNNEDLENTVFWAKRGVENNPIDFESHARLALAYQSLEKDKLALEHIISAHLFNRNHPRIVDILKTIFTDNGMVYQNFTFIPEYQIHQKSATEISIQANETPWKSYATCQALWQFDEKYQPGVRKLKKEKINQIQQKECLLNALISYERMKTGKENFPSFNIMGSALSNQMIDDFILYEVDLRNDPTMIFLLSEKKRQRLIKYLTTVRVKREVASR